MSDILRATLCETRDALRVIRNIDHTRGCIHGMWEMDIGLAQDKASSAITLIDTAHADVDEPRPLPDRRQ